MQYRWHSGWRSEYRFNMVGVHKQLQVRQEEVPSSWADRSLLPRARDQGHTCKLSSILSGPLQLSMCSAPSTRRVRARVISWTEGRPSIGGTAKVPSSTSSSPRPRSGLRVLWTEQLTWALMAGSATGLTQWSSCCVQCHTPHSSNAMFGIISTLTSTMAPSTTTPSPKTRMRSSWLGRSTAISVSYS